MPTYLTPGIYVEEVSTGPRPLEAVGTSTAGFVGIAPHPRARMGEAVAINNWSHFVREFAPGENPRSTALSHAVYGFFENGGRRCFIVNVGENGALRGGGTRREGIDLLREVDEVAIVAAPGFTGPSAYDALLSHAEQMKDRVAVLDAPEDGELERLCDVATEVAAGEGEVKRGSGLRARPSAYGAYYFPWISIRDPFAPSKLVNSPPSGHVAGIYARVDATRGVHKAPANEPVRSAVGLSYQVTHEEQGQLNSCGVNCIRYFSREGIRIWGARTLSEDPEWRYVNVRRLFNMVEETIARGTRWVVFEPNDATLWRSIRRDVGAFLLRLWRDGALVGRTPEEAFFVKCDSETNPPEVVDAGRVVAVIGIAPVKPAEFIVFRIGQFAGAGEQAGEVANG